MELHLPAAAGPSSTRRQEDSSDSEAEDDINSMEDSVPARLLSRSQSFSYNTRQACMWCLWVNAKDTCYGTLMLKIAATARNMTGTGGQDCR